MADQKHGREYVREVRKTSADWMEKQMLLRVLDILKEKGERAQAKSRFFDMGHALMRWDMFYLRRAYNRDAQNVRGVLSKAN